jgi:DNA repair exonuclease SbcCD ATPase subunit
MNITKCPICGQQHSSPAKLCESDLHTTETCSSYIAERELSHQAVASSLSLSETISEQNKKAERDHADLESKMKIIDSQIKEAELLANAINKEIDSLADSEIRLKSKGDELGRLRDQLENIILKIKETEDIEILKRYAEICKHYRGLIIK